MFWVSILWLKLKCLVKKFVILFKLILFSWVCDIKCIFLICLEENIIIKIIKWLLVWIRCILFIIFCLWLGWIINVVYWDFIDNLCVKFVSVVELL